MSLDVDGSNLILVGQGPYQGTEANLSSLAVFTNITASCFLEAPNLIAITIPPSVISIEDVGFANCSSLTRVVFQEISKLGDINNALFSNCSNLTNVEFRGGMSNLSSIGSNAFFNCGLTSINLTNTSNLGLINDYAFVNNSNLANVVFPASLLNIKIGSFGNTSNLTSATFPTGSLLSNIGSFAFANSGLLNLDLSGTQLVLLGDNTFDDNDLSNVIFPTSLETIGEFCFLENVKLSTITILQGSVLTTIGKSAFRDCGLFTLDLTNASNVSLIDEDVFNGNGNLNNVVLPTSIITIKSSAFANDSNLKTITFPPGSLITSFATNSFSNCGLLNLNLNGAINLEVIGKQAFPQNTALSNVTIPTSLKLIEELAFVNNSNLQTITIPPLSLLSSVGVSAFSNCDILNLDFTNTQITSLQDTAFFNNYNLLSVIFPISFTTIGQSAFANDSNLTILSIPTGSLLNFIGTSAFSTCGFVNLDLSKATQLQKTGSRAFENNSNLKSVLFPTSLITIDDLAFANDSNLSSFSLPLGINLSSIGIAAFSNCDIQLLDFTNSFKLDLINDAAFMNNSSLTSVIFPSSVTTIDNFAFANNSNLVSYSFANGSILNSIGIGTFSNCDFTELNLLNTQIEAINNNAFYNNKRIAYAVFPSSFTTIGNEAFANNSSLSSVTFESDSKLEIIGIGAFSNCVIQNLDLTSTTRLININNYAVFNNSTLINVSFPSSLILLGDYSFAENPNLVTVLFPKGIAVNSIGIGAFSNSDVTSVDFTSTTSLVTINNYAFMDNSNLPFLNFASSLTRIGDYSFANDVSITSVTFPPGSVLSSIGANAFSNCDISDIDFTNVTKLTTINNSAFVNNDIPLIRFPSSLTTLGNGAFANNCNLTEVSFPSGILLNSIGAEAFSFCDIRAIDLSGTNLKKIDDSAFFENKNLASAAFPSSLTTIGPQSFANDSNLISALFPVGSVLSTIQDSAFTNCRLSNLYLNVATNLSSIGNSAFSQNTGLGIAKLPEKLARIGSNAFELTGLSTITLPDSLISVGTNVFSNSYIQSINVTSNFNSFALFTEANVGLQETTMSTVYTLGSNSNPRAGCIYSTINFLTNPPLDAKRFQSIVRSTDLKLSLSTFNANSLVEYPYNLSSFSNANITTIGCIDNSFIPISFLPTDSNAITYFPINVGESVNIVDTQSTVTIKLKAISTINITANKGSYSRDYELSETFIIRYRPYIFSGSGSLFIETIYVNYIWQVIDGIISIITNPHPDTEFDLVNVTTIIDYWNISSSCFGNVNPALAWPNLSKITIPSIVSTIGAYAFSECVNLSTVLFQQPSLTQYIEDNAFYHTKVESIFLPASLLKIGKSAFQYDAALKNVIIPSNGVLSNIDNFAFFTTGLNSITLPDSLLQLNSAIFSNSPLISINVTSNFNNFVLFSQANVGIPPTTMSTIYTFGENTNSKAGCAYSTINFLAYPSQNASTFKTVVRSTDLSLTIEQPFNANYLVTYTKNRSAFSNAQVKAIGCIDKSVVPTSYLTRQLSTMNYIPINVGESVVFSNGLSSYTIKLSAFSTLTQTCSPGTFSNTYELSQTLRIDNFPYTFSGAGSVFLEYGPADYIWQVVNGIFSFVANPHPFSEFDLLAVNQISNFWNISSSCFGNTVAWSNLGSITIPSTVSTIGEFAFANCVNLSTLTFQSNSLLDTIGSNAFSNCRLSVLDLSPTQISFIGESALDTNAQLYEAYFPLSLTTVSRNAFRNTNLKAVSFYENLSVLGPEAFSNTPLKAISVTSSFSNYSILTETNVGLLSTFMSTIYTIGPNSNTLPQPFAYNPTNIFVSTPKDSTTFRQVVKSINRPLTFSNFDARYLYSYTYLNQSFANISLYVSGNGGLLPTKSVSNQYIPIVAGESYQVVRNSVSYNILQTAVSTIQVNNFLYEFGGLVNFGNVDFRYDAVGSLQLSGPYQQPCLLEGTYVKTPLGYRPIENIKKGDPIVSHCNLVKIVTKVGRWECKYEGHSLEQTMYKIPDGQYGAKKDVYLSHLHKVSDGKMMLYPKTLGLEKARKEEFVKDGKYTLYHLEVENGLLNHLVVNGECVVDSWT